MVLVPTGWAELPLAQHLGDTGSSTFTRDKINDWKPFSRVDGSIYKKRLYNGMRPPYHYRPD